MMSKVPNSGPLVNFITKTQQASNRKSPNLVLSIQEAIDLSSALGLVLARHNSLLEDIVELQRRTNAPTEIQMDGGTW
jgi:hypothetical protein